jgi:osmotically-inducible protein OsmY
MPRPVQDTMQAMQNVFRGGGGGGGPEGQANIETIKKLLAKERNVKIWESRGRIFLEGRVTSQNMKDRIQKLLEIYGNLVDLTEYRPEMDTFLADMELIKETIESTLNKSYDDQRAFVTKQRVSVSIVNDKIVISGELNTQQDIDQALHIAKIYNDNVVDNLSIRKQMIEVAAIFAKMKRTNTDRIGTSGATSAIITLPTITGSSPNPVPRDNPIRYFEGYEWTGGPVSVAPGVESEMNVAFENIFNKSAVLARPHLAAVNGQTSRFMGGGEKAIRTVTANASDVNYKEYGVILATTPSLTTDGRINLEMELEFSVPEANGEDFITFRHEGQAILSSGQGMVLSGLINESRSRELTSTPFLGKVPILKFFFSQRGENKEEEDLVLVTIPRVPGRVRRAGYPQSEETARTTEEAGWIHKPALPGRILDRLRGKRGEYWKDDLRVETEPAAPDYQEEDASEGTIDIPGAEETGYVPGEAITAPLPDTENGAGPTPAGQPEPPAPAPEETTDETNVGSPRVTPPAVEEPVDEPPRQDVPEVVPPEAAAPEGRTDEELRQPRPTEEDETDREEDEVDPDAYGAAIEAGRPLPGHPALADAATPQHATLREAAAFIEDGREATEDGEDAPPGPDDGGRTPGHPRARVFEDLAESAN